MTQGYAVLFPGQGSQAVGMLGKLAATSTAVAQTWQEASDVLGWDVARLAAEGPVEELNRTEKTQPALLAAGIAAFRVWQAQGLPPPAAMAGHSLGEYSALVAAGSLPFAEALRLVELRGQLMQQAVPQGEGGMAAVIGLDDAAVGELCEAFPGPGVLEPVNYNSPGQVVVAGHVAALDWLQANAKGHGARMVMRLPVSVPSHCSLMRTAAEQLAQRLASVEFQVPAIPVLHNLDAQPHNDAEGIRAALRDQLHRPVLWTQTIQALDGQGIRLMLECGPGKVLAGLVRRISSTAKAVALEEPAGMEQAANLAKGATA